MYGGPGLKRPTKEYLHTYIVAKIEYRINAERRWEFIKILLCVFKILIEFTMEIYVRFLPFYKLFENYNSWTLDCFIGN